MCYKGIDAKFVKKEANIKVNGVNKFHPMTNPQRTFIVTATCLDLSGSLRIPDFLIQNLSWRNIIKSYFQPQIEKRESLCSCPLTWRMYISMIFKSRIKLLAPAFKNKSHGEPTATVSFRRMFLIWWSFTTSTRREYN